MRKRFACIFSAALCIFLMATFFSGCAVKGDDFVSGPLEKISIKGIEYEKTGEVEVISKGLPVTVVGKDPTFVPLDEITEGNNVSDHKGIFFTGRKVKLNSFIMGKYEVTQELYNAVMDGQIINGEKLISDPSENLFKTVDGEIGQYRPVVNVTWYDAVYFCNILTEKIMGAKNKVYTMRNIVVKDGHIENAVVLADISKHGYRLPTEAEWEFAARGGNPDSQEWNYMFSGYDGTKEAEYGAEKNPGIDNVGWYDCNILNGGVSKGRGTPAARAEDFPGYGAHEVGKKSPNNLGLYDMTGNADEWCFDSFKEYGLNEIGSSDIFSDDGAVIDPAVSFLTKWTNYHVCRGGNWSTGGVHGWNPCKLTVSFRGREYQQSCNVGFRLVRSTGEREKSVCGIAMDKYEEEGMVTVIPSGSYSTVVGFYPGFMDADEKYSKYRGTFISGCVQRLGPFSMGKYEITKEIYNEVMDGQVIDGESLEPIPSENAESDCPVENVTWYDAVYFCNVFTEKTLGKEHKVYTIKDIKINSRGHIENAKVDIDISKKGYRLPTVAEWEFAARGGNPDSQEWDYVFSGHDGEIGIGYDAEQNSGLDSVGWYRSNSQGKIHCVGRKMANSIGLYDMSGNVKEWCFDNRRRWISDGDGNNPLNFTDSGWNVVSGGSFKTDAFDAVVTYDDSNAGFDHKSDLGFRVVRSIGGAVFPSVRNDKGISIERYKKDGMVEVVKENSFATIVGADNIISDPEYGSSQSVFREDRTVVLSPYSIGRYEVTQELYKTVMEGQSLGGKKLDSMPSACSGENGKLISGENQKYRPVENITWYDAVYFCNVFTEKALGTENRVYDIKDAVVEDGHIVNASVIMDISKSGYRLPTEAEWEFAARGGNPDAEDWNFKFSGHDREGQNPYFDFGFEMVGWDSGNADGSHEVGMRSPNSLGIYDMSGNVYEMCYDISQYRFYLNDYTKVNDAYEVDPVGNFSGSCRICRGGGWKHGKVSVKHRSEFYRSSDSGFRVARSVGKKKTDIEKILLDKYCKVDFVDVIPKGKVVTVNGTQVSILPPEYGVDNYCGAFPLGRKVTLSSYSMAKCEVTQELYKDIMQGEMVGGINLVSEPSFFTEECNYPVEKGENPKYRPVENITRFDAIYFCNKLTERTLGADHKAYSMNGISIDNGHIVYAVVTMDPSKDGYRLPTEAEWEFAARGGNSDAEEWNYKYAGVDGEYEDTPKDLLDIAWYKNSGEAGKTHEVGLKKANSLGIYDMNGNVREFCYDIQEFIDTKEVVNPVGGIKVDVNTCFIARGGGCNRGGRDCYVSYRGEWQAGYSRSNDLGFRLVRSTFQSGGKNDNNSGNGKSD